MLVRGGQELEVVQEDQHFSAHYQVRGDAEDRVRTSVLGRWGGNRVDATSGGCWETWGGGLSFPTAPLFRSPSKSGTTKAKKTELLKRSCTFLWVSSSEPPPILGILMF